MSADTADVDGMKKRENLWLIIGLCTCVPLFVLSIQNQLWAARTLKLYSLTFIQFSYILAIREKAYLKKAWLWKAISIITVSHAAVIILMFPVIDRIGYLFLFIIAVGEGVLFLSIVDRFKARQ
jgi:hypothetical protein